MQVCMSKNLARYFEYDDTSCIKTDTSTILAEVSAKINTACFAKGKQFHRVMFSPYSSAMYLYQQKQQQIYHFGFDFSLQELGLTTVRLISEVRAYLLRGHSVRDKTCTCNPHLPYARYMDYGLCLRRHEGGTLLHDSSANSSAREPCPLDASSQHKFTCEQICAELGISSLQSSFLLLPHRQSVHRILLLSGEFINQHEGEGETETWELCGRHTVDSEKSLLDFVSKHRLGIATNNPKIDYPLLHVHIRRLVQTGDLIHLASQGMLYAVPGMYGQKKCDDDIVAMWRGASSAHRPGGAAVSHKRMRNK